METAKRVVIVEDDIYLAEMVSQVLSIEGYNVTVLQDGAILIDEWDQYQPDLILLDIRMPKISGYEVLQSIRLRSSVPVIMLTGVMDSEAVSICFDLGADDYIKKPFYPRELIARVGAKLRRSTIQSC